MGRDRRLRGQKQDGRSGRETEKSHGGSSSRCHRKKCHATRQRVCLSGEDGGTALERWCFSLGSFLYSLSFGLDALDG